MNRTVVTVQTPIALATLALAVATSLAGYSALTGHAGSAELTPTERQAAVQVHEAQVSRAAAFPDCPAGPVHPAQAC
jgi:hypothetical protein